MTCTTNDTTAPLAVPPIDHPAPLIIAGVTPNRARSAARRESGPTSGVGCATSVLAPSTWLTSPTILALVSLLSRDNDRPSHGDPLKGILPGWTRKSRAQCRTRSPGDSLVVDE